MIRDALPNATFIGFTGTPISAKDRNTREVFGDYIDVYDMTQAVEDGATRPVYYESRVVHLKLDENTLALIDSTYDVLEQQSNSATIEKVRRCLDRWRVFWAQTLRLSHFVMTLWNITRNTGKIF